MFSSLIGQSNQSLLNLYHAISINQKSLEILLQKISFPDLKLPTCFTNQDDPAGLLRLAVYYQDGTGIPLSDSLAENYGLMAAKQKYVEAYLFLTNFYFQKKQYGKSYYYCQLAVNKGNDLALLYLADFYTLGVGGVEKSPKTAVDCYRRALSINPDRSLTWQYLGNAYKSGLGVGKSTGKANECYKKEFLIIRKNVDSYPALAYDLAQCYFNGRGTPQSLEDAIEWFKIAAHENPRAYYWLGSIYVRLKDLNKAIDYFRQGAQHEDSAAQFSLAIFLLAKHREESLAVFYLKHIIDKRQISGSRMGIAAESLGNCYEFGYGVEKSEPCALYYYRLAAHYNDYYGLKRLGTAYLKGELGLPARPHTADYFFELAKELEK